MKLPLELNSASLEEELLNKDRIEDLTRLLVYGLRLADQCALPSKLMSSIVQEAKTRYHGVLEGGRFPAIVFQDGGDDNMCYMEPQYGQGGAYTRVKKKQGQPPRLRPAQTHVGSHRPILPDPRPVAPH